MTKNFKVRLSVSLFLLALGALFLFTFNSIPFKIFFGLFAVVAGIELLSFFKNRHSVLNIIVAVLEITFLVFSTIFIAKASVLDIILIIFGVCGYDVFAYLFGTALGGLFFPKSRPFPFVSKNKTWEGTFMGLITSAALIGIILLIANSYDYIFFVTGPLALVGDLFESFLKRTFKVKDSNEIIIKNPVFAKLELLIGGSEGHGGYLDRIDSIAFTATMLLLIAAIL